MRIQLGVLAFWFSFVYAREVLGPMSPLHVLTLAMKSPIHWRKGNVNPLNRQGVSRFRETWRYSPIGSMNQRKRTIKEMCLSRRCCPRIRSATGLQFPCLGSAARRCNEHSTMASASSNAVTQRREQVGSFGTHISVRSGDLRFISSKSCTSRTSSSPSWIVTRMENLSNKQLETPELIDEM